MIAFSMAFTSYAQDMTPEEQAAAAVDQRKSLLKTIRYNLGPIAGMAQGAPFDAEVAERNARRIAVMATMIPEMLAVDTYTGKIWRSTEIDEELKARFPDGKIPKSQQRRTLGSRLRRY